MVVAFAREAVGVGEELVAPGADGELEVEEFVEGEALAGEFDLGEFGGEVEGAEGSGAGEGESRIRIKIRSRRGGGGDFCSCS